MALPIERRWKDDPLEPGAVEARAAALFRDVPPPRPLSGEQLSRIERRVVERLSRRGELPRWVKLLLGGGAFIGAPLAFAAIIRVAFAPAEPPPQHRPESEAPAAAAMESAAPQLGPVAEELPGIDLTEPRAVGGAHPRTESASSVKRAHLREVVRGAPVSRSAPKVAPSGQPAFSDGEAGLIQRAMRERAEGDHLSALRTLDEHRRKFPKGQLAGEALVHRTQSLIALGRREEAMEELSGLGSELEEMPRAAELRTLKAELLYQRGRVAESEEEFSAVLERGAAPTVEERALWGRALCRARAGDKSGSREDLELYLERFPSGRFAQKARELLAGR